MIQRKQTIFLLLAAILGLVHMMAWPLFIIQIVASAICIYAIFLYKRRKRQATWCLCAIIVNLAWYVCLAVMIQQGQLPEVLPCVACLPLISAILCFLARKGVIDDEKLVRAADRLR